MPTLHEVLLEIKAVDKTQKHVTSAGICWLVTDYSQSNNVPYWDELYGLMEKWPKGTGQHRYPIKCADYDDFYKAREAFMDAHRNGTMWVGEYGALRLELLDYLIEETKNDAA